MREYEKELIDQLQNETKVIKSFGINVILKPCPGEDRPGYLDPRELAIMVKAKPWTVMCSYNQINGTYACENKTYLTDILRDEWDFDGYVMSDWGAMNERVSSLIAGLELEMPSSGGKNKVCQRHCRYEGNPIRIHCTNSRLIYYEFYLW